MSPCSELAPLYDLVKNKRVALVGPAPYLTKYKLGPLIDSYDLVVRVNDVCPFNYKEHYGARTDIMFHSMDTRCITTGQLKHKLNQDPDLTRAIQLVVCPGLIAQNHGDGGCTTTNFESVNTYNLPFINIKENTYLHYQRPLGCEPNTGFMTLLLLADAPVKELFLTGFSFYHGSTNLQTCYYADYIKEEHVQSPTPWRGHNQAAQFRFFAQKVLTNPTCILTLDSYTTTLFNLHHRHTKIDAYKLPT